MNSHKEMTRYAFISHMEDYIKKLLKDPLHADTDEFLKYHKIIFIYFTSEVRKNYPRKPL